MERVLGRPGGLRWIMPAREAELAEKRARGHAGDGTKVFDEMGLVVVAGGGGDACPGGVTVLAGGA